MERRHHFVLSSAVQSEGPSQHRRIKSLLARKYDEIPSTTPYSIPPWSALNTMAPIALGSPLNRPTHLDAPKKLDHGALDGFGTRAIHVGSDPDPSTGAVIPAISLSTTYKQESLGRHKVRLDRR